MQNLTLFARDFTPMHAFCTVPQLLMPWASQPFLTRQKTQLSRYLQADDELVQFLRGVHQIWKQI